MRGSRVLGCEEEVAYAVLMEKYHQKFSEIDKIPVKLMLFLLRMAEAESQKLKQDMDKMKKGKK